MLYKWSTYDVLKHSLHHYRTTSLPGSMLRHQHSYSGPVGVGCTIVRSPAHSPPRMRRDTAPTLPFKTRSSSTSRPPEDPLEGGTGKSDYPKNNNDNSCGFFPVLFCYWVGKDRGKENVKKRYQKEIVCSEGCKDCILWKGLMKT